MAKIVECIPNISEGRNMEVVEAVLNEVRSTPGVTLLDHSSDPNHNRTVITFLGSPEGVAEAAVKLAKKAVELIDLTKHVGEHPRMGAVDVCPFVPVKEVSTEECVALSKTVAQRIWEEAGMPVFLYEDSASAPHRVNLAAIRKGQFEGMAQKVLEPEWEPDFGGRTIHPTAGCVAVGCRMPLVAFNINLNTSDIKIASAIALLSITGTISPAFPKSSSLFPSKRFLQSPTFVLTKGIPAAIPSNMASGCPSLMLDKSSKSISGIYSFTSTRPQKTTFSIFNERIISRHSS